MELVFEIKGATEEDCGKCFFIRWNKQKACFDCAAFNKRLWANGSSYGFSRDAACINHEKKQRKEKNMAEQAKNQNASRFRINRHLE
jgi:hypothetical protein